MWSHQLSFSRPLRHVRLVGPDGALVEDGAPGPIDDQATTDGALASNVPVLEDALSAEPTGNESSPHAEGDDSAMIVEQACQQVLARLSEIENRQQQSLVEMKQIAIDVAVAIASRLLMVQIPAGDQNVTELVNEAVAFFDKSGQLEVFLNPDDLANLDQSGCDVSFAAHTSVSLQPDADVGRGNCRVESDRYSSLFDWQERLEYWRHELLQAVTSDVDGQ